MIQSYHVLFDHTVIIKIPFIKYQDHSFYHHPKTLSPRDQLAVTFPHHPFSVAPFHRIRHSRSRRRSPVIRRLDLSYRYFVLEVAPLQLLCCLLRRKELVSLCYQIRNLHSQMEWCGSGAPRGQSQFRNHARSHPIRDTLLLREEDLVLRS